MDDRVRWKIFPRNLTARDAAGAWPENDDGRHSASDLFQLDLDKAFFPGLTFEFRRRDGATVEDAGSRGAAAEAGLTRGDLPLYLWALTGRTSLEQDAEHPPTFFFHGRDGLEVWGRVRELLPERVAILLGSEPGPEAAGAGGEMARRLAELRATGESRILRDERGRVARALLVGERAAYLDRGGIPNLGVESRGEPPRRLCAPYQYDFQDRSVRARAEGSE